MPGMKDGVSKTVLAVVAAGCLVIGFYLGMVTQGSSVPVNTAAQGEQDLTAEISQAESQTRARPDDPEAWTVLGNLYFDTDQPEKSIEAYERSLALRPGDPDVLTDQGAMYREIKEFDKALDSFNKAIAVDKTHVIAHYNKSIILLHDKNDRAGAIAVLESLAARNPAALVPGGERVTDMLRALKQDGQSAPVKSPNFLN